ncbi:sugar phosphate isomerase/epimerase family protein [Salinibacterium sp. PAMC 21357]|uniref:sugar phosphate isomerase/epimerase family protein n=1 Tax=Salinibacterium sp. PAMC 21357 TaxID=1112215 RepID=UPI000288AA26|nr:sugar phosphate isomerase/epimerase [Salinibacterium sp. PAMC 21357]
MPLSEVADLARTFGASVELRVAADEPVTPTSSARELAEIADVLAGVTISGLATYVKLGAHSAVDDIQRSAEIAGALGAPALRIFAGAPRSQDAVLAARLASAADAISDTPISILLETHDEHSSGEAVGRVLTEAFGASHVRHGAIWDLLHPLRAGETLDETAEHLNGWIREAQLKDVASLEDLTPVLPGTGSLPLPEFVHKLRAIGFAGPWILEYERRWYPQTDILDDSLKVMDRLFTER